MALLLSVLLLAALLAVTPPVRVAAQTLLLLPAVFPSAPVDPLSLVTAPPTRTEHTFAYAAGTVDVDMYHPAGEGQHGGVILLLGARPVPRRDPLLVHFAEALAREGVVVLIPESSNLLAGRIVPEEIQALQQSYELLLRQAGVDPARTGFLGFSVGGGLSVVAAASPPLRDRVRFVNSLGGYYDAADLLVDIASGSLDLDGRVDAWQPSELAVEVLATQVVDALPDPADRALLARAFLEHSPVDEVAWSMLTPAGARVRALLSGPSRSEARALVDALPAATRDGLRDVSPSAHVGELRAHLYLMHDTADTYIPYPESRHLAAAAPQALVRATEFSIFAHVIPDRPVPWQTFLPDLWALFWHLHAVLLDLL